MKILYHHRTRSRDGQRVHIDGLIHALRRAGHEVVEVGPRTPEQDDPQRAGGAVHPWLRPLRELAELLYNLREMLQIARVARTTEFEALYSRHALFGLAPALMRRWLRLPWIVEVNAPLAQERSTHGGLCLSSLARWLETRTLNAADTVVVVTAVMSRMLTDQGVESARIEVHPNGIDAGSLRKTPSTDPESRPDEHSVSARTLGFVGFVRDWNRLERAFGVLQRRPQLRFVVVGDGPDRPRLEALAVSRGIADRFQFVGAVPAEEVRRHVAGFAVALITETPPYASPLKLLDYLAEGRAVLAPDRDNLREVLTHGVNALLFDPDSDADFESCLENLLDDATLRRELGRAGRRTLDERGLTWDHNAERVVRRFQQHRVESRP